MVNGDVPAPVFVDDGEGRTVDERQAFGCERGDQPAGERGFARAHFAEKRNVVARPDVGGDFGGDALGFGGRGGKIGALSFHKRPPMLRKCR